MLKTGLEFAPGTSDDSKKAVTSLISPVALMGAYRTAKAESGTGDIVLFVSDQSPDILGGTRAEYAQHLLHAFGRRASEFKIYNESAHTFMSMPSDTEAVWLVVDLQGTDMPIMCIIYAIPYEVSATG